MRIVDDPELEKAGNEWLDGGSALPLIRLFTERGEVDMATVPARAALAMDPCPDAGEIEQLLVLSDETILDSFRRADVCRPDHASSTVTNWPVDSASPHLAGRRAPARTAEPGRLIRRLRSITAGARSDHVRLPAARPGVIAA
ncbi:MAG TPA: hypothetical protein VN605_05910 [Thermoanaerobaculia bacterium]|nr:hypothetical protein [Thermoanaerobaculia bacterium]